MKQQIHYVILTGIILYTLTLLMLTALWILAPEQNAWIEITNILAPYLFFPLVVLLPLALALRSSVASVAQLALLILAGFLFIPHLIPDRPMGAAAPGQSTLRVVTFNQLYANDEIHTSLSLLLEHNPDIIALQELSPATVEYLESTPHIRQQYPYQALNTDVFPGHVGLLSRYPIEQTERMGTLRGMHAVLNVQGTQITLINVHPSVPAIIRRAQIPVIGTSVPMPTFNTSRRNRELEHLLTTIHATEGPLIVVGDFNTSDRERIYQRFASHLHDAFAETGWGFGHTYSHNAFGLGHALSSWLPRVRIDYIWSSQHITPLHAYVNCQYTGSDHCMLIADLHLANSSSTAAE